MFTDILRGRRITPINDNWNFILRDDMGGLGLAAYLKPALLLVLNMPTDTWLLDTGYKGIWVDCETGTKGQHGYFSYDTVTHGSSRGVV